VPTTHLAPSGDLPAWAALLACALALVSLGMLLVEMRQRERGGLGILVSGLVALVALLGAVVRPVRVAARESVVGARVVVLADASRSMALKSDSSGETREEVRDAALVALAKAAKDARLTTLAFGDGAPRPLVAGPPQHAVGMRVPGASGALSADPGAPSQAGSRDGRSDLGAALRALALSADERPAAVVVVSDGRLDDPPEEASPAQIRALADQLRVPIHTIATTRAAKADASVRRVAAAGAAVAHVPLPLRVDIGCAGGLACDELTVTAKELREDGPPALLASGLAHSKDGHGTIDLTVTLERAGIRILEIAIAPPNGDTIPENDRRLVTVNVARERVRVLHVAGRPTNDVRALRQWLKSDASIDVVAFFILRTNADRTNAPDEELALIPFPVDELFSEHLPSFDAIVLQDFETQPYHVEQYLPALARYVRTGGGLIMVGGPNSFVAGGYAGTPLGDVLPIGLDGTPGATAADTASFVPAWTDQGRAAPLLAPLRAVVGDELPNMPGANVLGDVHEGGIALWTHPSRKTKTGAPMPVLAVADVGDGRTIALGVDGGWLFEFSSLGARTVGRGHGALWDGLLGWLMRDPRFEPAQMETVAPSSAASPPRGSPDDHCTAGLPSILRVQLLPPAPGAPKEEISVDVSRIDKKTAPLHLVAERPQAVGGANANPVVDIPLPALEAGGYSARLRIGNGAATRRDFACEAGGDEWADSRPDPERLRAIAAASGGSFAWAPSASGGDPPAIALPLPKPTVVSAERHVVPLAPPWAWALFAACAFGAHWLARRRSGLS
jgi:uncharacterized membrane protein